MSKFYMSGSKLEPPQPYSRLDVLYGSTVARPEFACLVVGVKPWWVRLWLWITRA